MVVDSVDGESTVSSTVFMIVFSQSDPVKEQKPFKAVISLV